MHFLCQNIDIFCEKIKLKILRKKFFVQFFFYWVKIFLETFEGRYFSQEKRINITKFHFISFLADLSKHAKSLNFTSKVFCHKNFWHAHFF